VNTVENETMKVLSSVFLEYLVRTFAGFLRRNCGKGGGFTAK
jgi:hypothetical protein